MQEVNFQRIFRSGDRLTICLGNKEFPTRIDEVTSPETFTVVQPWSAEREFEAQVGDEYRIICSTTSGVHCCNVQTIAIGEESSVKTMHLRYLNKYSRIQNRKAFRCQVMLPIEIRHKPRERASGFQIEKWIHTKTLDISDCGVKVRLEQKYSTGDIVQMKIHIDKFGFVAVLPLITGIVVRAQPAPDSTKEVICGIEFFNVESKVKDMLAKFIMICQRNSAAKD